MNYIDATKCIGGGTGRYIQELINNSNIYDYLIGDKDSLNYIFPQKNIISVEKFNALYPKLLETDVVHFPSNDMEIIYKNNQSKCKIIGTIFDVTPLIINLGHKMPKAIWKRRTERLVDRADAIITVSENSKKDISYYFHINPEKIFVTYCGISDIFNRHQLTSNQVDYYMKKYAIQNGYQILLVGGSLMRHKNLFRVLMSFRQIKHKQTVLIILQNGKKLKLIRTLLGLKNRIVLLKGIKDNELNDLYCLSDIFLFISLYEGFGIPPLEAMKCGTVVVTSNTSSIPEVTDNIPIMVDPYNIREISDTIDFVLDHEEEIKKQQQNRSDNLFNQYRWEKTVAGTSEVFTYVSKL